MAKTLAFFDTTETEKQSFRHYFSGSDFKLLIFDESIENIPIKKYSEAEVVSVFVTSHIDEELLSHLPKLKLVSARSTGFDNIDLEATKKRRIAVANVPGYGQTAVAEYTIMLMLALARKFPKVTQSVNTGQINYSKLSGFTLHGKVLGVIGTGKIGLSVIKLAKAFGMHVIAYDPFANPQVEQEFRFSYVSFNELLRGSDFITLHAPLTKDNRHLINRSAFKKVKPGVMLVNTARGELVDSEALIEALQNHTVAAAALDVFEGEEALELENEIDLLNRYNKELAENIIGFDLLTKMDNVILSPHNAFNCKEALAFIRKTTVKNILGFLAGKPQNIVS